MFKVKLNRIIGLAALLAVWLASPTSAWAHGGGPVSAIAGPLAWGFLGFGILVIAAVAGVLFSGQLSTEGSAEKFDELAGFNGYLTKMRLFSRNARLYMVHVVGMDVIYGTWSVLFNLYLLGVGFDIAFVGLRIALQAGARAVASIPAGALSDRIGRKLSFILGDGMGAAMALIAITSESEWVLLATGVIGGLFSALHGVAEPAFMAENSEDYERVHLFSVSGGTRTAAAIIGAALAGLIPMIYGGDDMASRIEVYRTISFYGIGGWFASLIPALLLKQVGEAALAATDKKGLLSNIVNPDRVWRITAPELFIALGAGFTLPLLNVFFQTGVGSAEIEIGAVFSAGEAFLVVGSFLAPLVAARLGKVNSVVVTRLASIPFILLFAFAIDIGLAVGSILGVAAFAYVARITLFNMGGPVHSAFAMEILDPGERGTQVGIQQAFASALSGGASYYGAQMMNLGDFQTPFFIMAACYLAGTVMFWRFFGNWERDADLSAAAAD